MKSSATRHLAALLALLSLPLAAPSLQPQQNPPTASHQTPGAPSIAPLSDGWDPTTPNPTPTINFIFVHPGVPIPQYALTIQQNNHGHYRGEQVQPATPSDPQPFNTDFDLSPQTTAEIFAISAKLKHFNLTCASTAKNIASTGTKILRYTAPDSPTTSCTYNYSENKEVQSLTQILQSIAETMDQGRHLDFLHRYDRLGLDHAITALADEASTGQALELNTIAPTLRSIADDPEVIQRVRTRAAALLSTLPAAGPTQ